MMKYALLSLLAILLILPTPVLADVGIGLKWVTEGEAVRENSQTCITYYLYNPFDQDVKGYLEALGDLDELAVAEEPKIIPAGTSSKEAIPTDICFTVPKLYKEECLLGPLLCTRLCDEEPVVYNGEVQSAYNLNFVGGTGSSTGSSISARMRLLVNCEKVELDPVTGFVTQPTSMLAGLIVIVVLLLLYYRRRKSGDRPFGGGISGVKPQKNPWN
ncbi:MAG: hypothetical protein ABIH52_01910 [Candidatus Aenigmatarchaeota archaeon]|nr:hypothetical protein [Nanoarchaeota archaeon]